MLRENVSTTSTSRLDNNNLRRALLTNYKTTDRDTGLSPAQVIFGCLIMESLLIKPSLYTPSAEWLLTRDMRELTITSRPAKKEDRLTEHTKALHGLKISEVVQNKPGPHTTRWEGRAP